MAYINNLKNTKFFSTTNQFTLSFTLALTLTELEFIYFKLQSVIGTVCEDGPDAVVWQDPSGVRWVELEDTSRHVAVIKPTGC